MAEKKLKKLCSVTLVVSNSLRPCGLFATLWTEDCQAPLSMGFSREQYWMGLPCAPSGDFPDPGIEPASLASPALAGGFFTTSTTWKAQQTCLKEV